MSHTLKQNNRHRLRPTECVQCRRQLPKRAFRQQCATCIKREQGKDTEYYGKAGAA